jgi:NADP-dependent 3-hydroxy acid dehydrogenase YdfG
VSTALAFAERGYAVVLTSRSEKRLRTVASQCRAAGAASALPVVTDVRDEAAVQALFIQAASVHGSVDVAVNTAILGTFHVARSALAEFRHQGRGTLVVVNSLLGQVAVPEMGATSQASGGRRVFSGCCSRRPATSPRSRSARSFPEA